jgi:hypothetical protein
VARFHRLARVDDIENDRPVDDRIEQPAFINEVAIVAMTPNELAEYRERLGMLTRRLQLAQRLPRVLKARRIDEHKQVANAKALALHRRRKWTDTHGVILGQRCHHRGFAMIHVAENGDDRQGRRVSWRAVHD